MGQIIPAESLLTVTHAFRGLMPLITIKTSKPIDPALVSEMIMEIRKVGSIALNCPPGNIWTVFEKVPDYGFSVGDDPSFMSPIVVIQANAGRPKAAKEALVASVTSILSSYLSLPPALVWIYYQEMNPADIWFQNRWAG
jgi:phenylpyruvate tautomerase PptA (4-oxalocrotonate tautomerase family)